MADEVRHSQALEAELIRDPELAAQTEVQNGLRQFQAVVEMVENFLDTDRLGFTASPRLALWTSSVTFSTKVLVYSTQINGYILEKELL